MSLKIWIDIETGGLNDKVIPLKKPILIPNGQTIEYVLGSQYYPILEIAIIITDEKLKIIDEYRSAVKVEKLMLDKMDQWCIEQHKKTGLSLECLEERKTLKDVEKECCEFLKKHGLETEFRKRSPMCGNSVHFDRTYINAQCPELSKYFGYRNIDMSSVYELIKESHPSIISKVNDLKSTKTHLALDDIKMSINEGIIYKSNLIIDNSLDVDVNIKKLNLK